MERAKKRKKGSTEAKPFFLTCFFTQVGYISGIAPVNALMCINTADHFSALSSLLFRRDPLLAKRFILFLY